MKTGSAKRIKDKKVPNLLRVIFCEGIRPITITAVESKSKNIVSLRVPQAELDKVSKRFSPRPELEYCMNAGSHEIADIMAANAEPLKKSRATFLLINLSWLEMIKYKPKISNMAITTM